MGQSASRGKSAARIIAMKQFAGTLKLKLTQNSEVAAFLRCSSEHHKLKLSQDRVQVVIGTNSRALSLRNMLEKISYLFVHLTSDEVNIGRQD